MLNPLKIITKFIKSGNQKELDRIQKVVKKINELETYTTKLEDKNFPEKTNELIINLKQGKSLDDLLPEAFALVRDCLLYTSPSPRD